MKHYFVVMFKILEKRKLYKWYMKYYAIIDFNNTYFFYILLDKLNKCKKKIYLTHI